MKHEPHEKLIDTYLSEGNIPYKTALSHSDFKIFREFEILSSKGLRRFDLFIINDFEKRYDILEFKSRALLLKDAYQVYGYMHSFIEARLNESFKRDYKYCFHLIGREFTDERLNNLVLMESPVFKIHVFYDINKKLEVYPLDTNNCFFL